MPRGGKLWEVLGIPWLRWLDLWFSYEEYIHILPIEFGNDKEYSEGKGWSMYY